MKKIMHFLKLATFAVSLLVLSSCGGGGASTTGVTTPVQSGSEVVFTGGGAVPPDSNIAFVPFSSTSASQTSSTSTQAGLLAIQAGLATVSGILKNEQILLPKEKWISQYKASCSTTSNGYCGFASMLMGATYLNPKLAPPAHYGYGTANGIDGTKGDDVVGKWIATNVNNGFSNSNYAICGGSGLGVDNEADFGNFARSLGIEAKQFHFSSGLADENAKDDFITSWIATALTNGYPVMAQVPYQGNACTGRWSVVNGKWTQNQTEAQQYAGGNNPVPVEMVSSNPPNSTSVKANVNGDGKTLVDYDCGGTNISHTTNLYPPGHWVLITELNQTSVKVYDPDPIATSSDAGIRQYSTVSFLAGLKKKGDKTDPKNPVPIMYELCPSTGCPSSLAALATPVNPIVLSTNQNYTANNTQPIVNALAPNSVLSASGLPSGLSMETEGRIVGNTGIANTYSVPVTMTSTVNGVLQYANSLITVVTQAAASIVENLQFITPSSLNSATVGNYYLQPLGITGNAEAPTFSLINGNLPGLNLQNGQIVGTPTQAGVYSVDIQAATSTSTVTKTFTLVVNPAPATAVPAPQPVLSGINPSSVTGSDGQQTVVFTGSGFADGARVKLTDTTNGGTYLKTPVSINSAGTEITISADFTSNSATWSASIIPLTGNPSATITFHVVAPVSPGPVVSSVSPSVLTAASAAQTITLTGTNFRTGAVVEITNLQTGIGASVQPVSFSSVQLTVSNPFATPTMWGVRVLNSDGTSSASTDILVNAPTSTVVPAVPSLVSPGTATGPGNILQNTTAPLSWSGDASASYYEVAVRDLGSGALVVNTTTLTPSYAVNLLNGKQYRWNAAACNTAGCSNYAPPLYFQTPQPTVAVPPPAISSLSITSVPADSTTRSLTINGSNFAAGNVVMYRWGNPPGGTTASATVNSPAQITTTFNPGNVADTIYVKVCQTASSNVCSNELPISVTLAGTTTTPALSITTASLASATVGTGYAQNVAVGGGQTPYTWTVSSGLPSGLNINSATGAISGTPSASGTFNFTVTATDSSSPQKTASQALSLTVVPSTSTAPGSLTISNLTPVWDTASPAGPAVTLNWSSSSGATSYAVYRNGVLIYPSSGTFTGTTFYNNVGLTSGQTYSYYILATNPAGSTQSNTINVGPMPNAPVAVPSISNVSPSSYPASGSNQTMTINGANFQSGATLTFLTPSGSAIASLASKLTFVSSNQLSYQFNDGSDVGTWYILVNNPGGQSSLALSFSVP